VSFRVRDHCWQCMGAPQHGGRKYTFKDQPGAGIGRGQKIQKSLMKPQEARWGWHSPGPFFVHKPAHLTFLLQP